MRKIIMMFIVIFSLFQSQEGFAGRKIQWQKFMNDTTKSFPYADWKVEGYCIDTNNNIYVAYSQNGNDTTMSIISKLSPTGELLWRTTVVPFNLNQKVYTRFSQSTYLFVDNTQNIVFVTSGFDTAKNFILLSKWDTNGVLISQKIDTAIDEELEDIYIGNTGEIYTIQHTGLFDSSYLSVKGYDKNFNNIYNDFSVVYLNASHIDSWLCVAAKDSLVSVAYTLSNQGAANTLVLYQRNKNTMDTSWVFTRNGSQVISDLEYKFDNLYLVGNNGLEMFSTSNGTIIASDPNYTINRCFFDTLSNKIYALSGTYFKKMFVFDKNLNYVNEVTSNHMIRDFCKRDNIISLTASNSQVPYRNLFYATRVDTNYNIIDEFSIMLSPYWEYAYPSYGILDYKKDLVFISRVWSYIDIDTVINHNIYAVPLQIQKVCYDCIDDIKGCVFFDNQNNCQYDSTCSIVEGNLIHLMPENIYTTTDSLGNYTFVKPTGIATIEYIPKFNFAYLCNNSSYTVNMANGYNDTLDFGLRFKEAVYDISTTILSGTARPGFQQYTIIDAENLSTQKVYNKTLKVSIDSQFTLVSSSVPPDSISGNLLFWFIDSMNAGATHTITLLNLVNNGTLGYQYKHITEVSPQGDLNLLNNTDTMASTVIGSVDPNYKAANPVGITSHHFIENNIPINYYVEFQNTGTDTAFNIKIFDDLDNDLDINTLVVKKASHPMHYKIVNRQLQFYFDNVLLVDSNKDYKKSIGYLTYTIMPKKSADGTLIHNNAAIYFDFNEPVITNTTFHTIGRPGCLFDDENLNDFNFFPNPVSDQSIMITVNMATDEKYDIVLSDIAGKEIYKLSSQKDKKGKYQHPINFSNMVNAGIYFLTLKTSSNNISKKVFFGH